MPRYVSDYTTREDVQDQLEKADPGEAIPAPITAEFNEFVAYVDRAIHAASQFVTRYTYRVFVPYKDSREYLFNKILYDGDFRLLDGMPTLRLREDLLVVSAVNWNDALLSASYYREAPHNQQPYEFIEFDWNNLPSFSTGFNDGIDVIGMWGYHDNTSQMYTQVDSSVTINSSAISLTVTSAALYRTWQYIKIEDELLQITARNTSTNALTVKRGVNGTAAAAHTTQAVSIFNPIEDIRLAATRLAAWAYNNRNDLGTQLTLPDGGSIKNEVPAFVYETLDRLQRHVFEAD